MNSSIGDLFHLDDNLNDDLSQTGAIKYQREIEIEKYTLKFILSLNLIHHILNIRAKLVWFLLLI